MKLYEAIRLGSTLHPQVFNTLRTSTQGVTTGTCALGSALVAIGIGLSSLWILDDLIPQEWKKLYKKPCCCPIDTACTVLTTVEAMITHLNDYHGLTREKIADWLEPIEERWYESAIQPGVSTQTPTVRDKVLVETIA